MLCYGAERLPEGRKWCYELKLDGFRRTRTQSRADTSTLVPQSGKMLRPLSDRGERAHCAPDDTVIDGEVVALDERGHPSFDLLQGPGTGEPRIVLYAFDLLMCGVTCEGGRLRSGVGQLSQAIKQLPDTVRYLETFSVPLADIERAVRQHELVEGIVAKRAGSPYRSGERCGDWLKWQANPRLGVRDRWLHSEFAPWSIHCWSASMRAAISCTPAVVRE
jgi:ATP-dependent DNA ligase